MKAKSISAVLPVCNEVEALHELVDRTERVLSQLYGDAWEVLIVDDGSTDGSYEVARELENRHQNVRVLRHEFRRTKSKAMETGFNAASSNRLIIVMDADLQYLPEEIPLLIAKMSQGYDMVNGRRKNRVEGPAKRLTSLIYNILMRTLFLTPLWDNCCNFAVFKARFAENLNLLEGDNRYLTAILKHARGAERVAEVMVTQLPRRYGKSKYSAWKKFWFGLPQALSAWYRIFFTDFYEPRCDQTAEALGRLEYENSSENGMRKNIRTHSCAGRG